ncbi:aquaglyceroporin Gla [Streptococcus cuniculipharyngis]|uniref:Aquaporin family protein n=1 Tax=Streptococcus cuniculipharyngis TaxID=1562651 RepID=A0A5C5SD52_9STRE|nr:aquaglyceroporin Gla [Streptococcus cuniculipharyngis]TWS98212.1 aquaporin family protein [Streptococcus cuniculipharyngis]
MDVTWSVKYLTEFIATAFLIILGNGVVANVSLKGTKGQGNGLILVSLGYGLALMLPALMFGNVSGNHVNPALTLGLAVSGLFPWGHVLPYILAQFLGAIFGQLVVVGMYGPYFRKTEDGQAILGSFSIVNALADGRAETRKQATVNGLISEFFGSFVLFFGVLALTKNFFGAELVDKLVATGYDQTVAETTVAPYTTGSLAVAHLGIGFLLMAIIAGLGGPTGAGLNPARDLGPRLVHHFLPKSVLGQAKSDSQWWYAWVGVVAPILAGILAVALFKALYL